MKGSVVAPGRDRLWIWLFWLAYVLAGASTTVVTDSARDLIAAWDIAQGVQFPLRGPELYSTWHLGPIWYYLLAIPLFLTHSAALAALLVAALAGLKFPLAYRLGLAFGGIALARLALIAIALPGWWMFEWLVSSHTNLAATCLLGYTLLLLQWARTGQARQLALAGLVFSLAIHAHPTSMFWAVLAVPALHHRHRHGGVHWPQLLMSAAMFVLPFAPMLWDEMHSGWPMWSGTREFVASRADPSITRLPQFLRDLSMLDGSRMPSQFLPGATGLAIALHGLQVVLIIAALAGLLVPRAAGRKSAWLALISMLCASAFVMSLRPEIPYWMTYSLMPVMAATLALGWKRLLDASTMPIVRTPLLMLWAAAGLAFLLMSVARIDAAADGRVATPYRVVGGYADPLKRVDATIPNATFPVIAQEQLTRWLCAQAHPISLHGDGAALQRLNQGSLRSLHCSDDLHWHIGGDRGEAIALYPAFALRQAGIATGAGFGLMRRVSVDDVVHAAAPQADDLIRAYPPWPLTQQTTATLRVQIPAHHRWIAVSNLRPVFNGLDAPSLRVDGRTLPARARTAATWFFRMPGDQPGILEIHTGDPSFIEVLALADVPTG